MSTAKRNPLFIFFLLFFLLHETPMSRREVLGSPETSVNVATYEGLLQAIRETRTASQARIEAAVEQEKVREAWAIGKLIDVHILLQKERQQYGKQVVLRLANDLGMSESELNRMVEFARAYPKDAPGRELSWSHYRALLGINDPAERDALAQKAQAEHWNRDRIREEVHKRTHSSSSPNDSVGDPLPVITPGLLNTYQIFKQEGQLRIDLGFDTYFDLPRQYEKKVKEGEIVTLDGSRNPKRATLNDLYTYRAKVTDVFDGDTFHALIDLGFDVTLYQRLRLRRLDAPELVSAEGKEAKAALEKILSRAKGSIILKISKTDDQYGRYLVDVWIDGKNIDQELLDTGLLQVRGDA